MKVYMFAVPHLHSASCTQDDSITISHSTQLHLKEDKVQDLTEQLVPETPQ